MVDIQFTYCNVTDVNKLSNLSDSDFITLTIAGEQQQKWQVFW